MFFIYLRRELRRRMRQAIFIVFGLALGIGLVITVTAASSGVKDAQADVLHSLYGVGTDVTVTQTPTSGSGGPFGFGVRGRTGTAPRPAAGTKINVNRLVNFGLGTLSSSSVTSISRMQDVSAAAGGLTLTDMKVTGKIPAINSSSGPSSGGFPGGGGGGGFRANFNTSSFTVAGVDLAHGEVGPLSSGKVTSGSTFSTTDTNSNVAVLDSNYATQQKLKAGSTITVGGTNFKVIGIVSVPQGGNPPNVYIPLARAQQLAGLTGKVNTIYVSASSAANINAVAKFISGLLPKATVTTSSSLASEVTGSLASAASLANNLGKWLAIAVLVAAFLLASLLTMAAVTRRVREFGTLKAFGWPSWRIIRQVMGESIVIGIVGGVAGVALGFLGATLVQKLAKPLTASLGQSTGSATPGGAQTFGGGRFPGGGGGFPGGGGFSRAAADAAHSVTVHLTAPVTVGAVILAVVLAIAGGLIAGSFGGWRAARLRPAAALARVE
ncbi:MAG TPA: ABC transporter permease [Streptosporangiaceae bacterium]|nr:ABC transporter permease [Streptosporangiaceae bacterium]